MNRYLVDIENAFESGEIMVPAQYKSRKQLNALSHNGNRADSIKKWKELLDSGAITREEYEMQKKKLLDADL